MKRGNPAVFILVAFGVFLAASAPAAETETHLYWGDTHNHTSYSFDVFLFGTPYATPDTAYRYAQGLPVVSPTDHTRWQINTPLDFLVVADHAEMIGNLPLLYGGDERLINSKTGKVFLEVGGTQTDEELLEVYKLVNYAGTGRPNEYGLTPKDLYRDMAGEMTRTPWENEIEAAERHNDPGKFTTLIGWEWTSTTGGANLHRVIFMAEDGPVARKFLPYTTLESDDPEDLWDWLEMTSERTGATFVAIPHNSNLSLGKMFPLLRENGEPVDTDYARKRAKWEPAVEATQIKGDSETHPLFSPNDEFADFETYEFVMTPAGGTPAPTPGDYVRSGLKRGLELEAKLGANPFKLGLIGSTDSHTGMAAVEEDNFAGKGQHDAKPAQRSHPTGIGSSKGWDMGAAGYVGVWATENTRKALVAAFKRKEVYASTGPRMSLRFFGGFDFAEDDAEARDLAAVGYEKGVPMGGDLSGGNGKAPTFLIDALKDPKGANLDRIQIVKGWLSGEGKAEEKVYDVAMSDGRTDGSQAVGNTVDLKTGKYTNSIGDVRLTTVWEDPDFEANQSAFYYVRLIEIPTPRYSLLDAIALGIDVAQTNHPATIQERAYSSPIWYTP